MLFWTEFETAVLQKAWYQRNRELFQIRKLFSGPEKKNNLDIHRS